MTRVAPGRFAELNAATVKLIHCARNNGKILGLFLSGTERVPPPSPAPPAPPSRAPA